MKLRFYIVTQKICLIRLDKIKIKNYGGKSPFLKRKYTKQKGYFCSKNCDNEQSVKNK